MVVDKIKPERDSMEEAMMMLFGKEIGDLLDDGFDGSGKERHIFMEVFFGNVMGNDNGKCLDARIIHVNPKENKPMSVFSCGANSPATSQSFRKDLLAEDDCTVNGGLSLMGIKRRKLLDGLPSDSSRELSCCLVNKREDLVPLKDGCSGEDVLDVKPFNETTSCRLLESSILPNVATHALVKQHGETEVLGDEDDGKGSMKCKAASSLRRYHKEITEPEVAILPVSQESSPSELLMLGPVRSVDEKSEALMGVKEKFQESCLLKPDAVDVAQKGAPATDLRHQLREHIDQVFMAAGWGIELQKRSSRSTLQTVYITPNGRIVYSLPKAWRSCGESLFGARVDLMWDENGRQWEDISGFWCDLSNTMVCIEEGMQQVGNCISLHHRWSLLDPFVTVVCIDKKIGVLRAGRAVKVYKGVATDLSKKKGMVLRSKGMNGIQNQLEGSFLTQSISLNASWIPPLSSDSICTQVGTYLPDNPVAPELVETVVLGVNNVYSLQYGKISSVSGKQQISRVEDFKLDSTSEESTMKLCHSRETDERRLKSLSKDTGNLPFNGKNVEGLDRNLSAIEQTQTTRLLHNPCVIGSESAFSQPEDTFWDDASTKGSVTMYLEPSKSYDLVTAESAVTHDTADCTIEGGLVSFDLGSEIDRVDVQEGQRQEGMVLSNSQSSPIRDVICLTVNDEVEPNPEFSVINEQTIDSVTVYLERSKSHDLVTAESHVTHDTADCTVEGGLVSLDLGSEISRVDVQEGQTQEGMVLSDSQSIPSRDLICLTVNDEVEPNPEFSVIHERPINSVTMYLEPSKSHNLMTAESAVTHDIADCPIEGGLVSLDLGSEINVVDVQEGQRQEGMVLSNSQSSPIRDVICLTVNDEVEPNPEFSVINEQTIDSVTVYLERSKSHDLVTAESHVTHDTVDCTVEGGLVSLDLGSVIGWVDVQEGQMHEGMVLSVSQSSSSRDVICLPVSDKVEPNPEVSVLNEQPIVSEAEKKFEGLQQPDFVEEQNIGSFQVSKSKTEAPFVAAPEIFLIEKMPKKSEEMSEIKDSSQNKCKDNDHVESQDPQYMPLCQLEESQKCSESTMLSGLIVGLQSEELMVERQAPSLHPPEENLCHGIDRNCKEVVVAHENSLDAVVGVAMQRDPELQFPICRVIPSGEVCSFGMCSSVSIEKKNLPETETESGEFLKSECHEGKPDFSFETSRGNASAAGIGVGCGKKIHRKSKRISEMQVAYSFSRDLPASKYAVVHDDDFLSLDGDADDINDSHPKRIQKCYRGNNKKTRLKTLPAVSSSKCRSPGPSRFRRFRRLHNDNEQSVIELTCDEKRSTNHRCEINAGEAHFQHAKHEMRGPQFSSRTPRGKKSVSHNKNGKRRGRGCRINDDDLLIAAVIKKKDNSQSRALRKLKSQNGSRKLLLRSPGKGGKHSANGKWFSTRARTVLSWLIDSGVVLVNDVIQCRSPNDDTVIKDGRITKDGILCKCCKKMLPMSEFKVHAGFKLHRPCLNLCLKSGKPIALCQLQAWSAEYKARKGGMRAEATDEVDQNDDTCGLCADGGELICCDNCPSTFHQACLSVQELPDGSWYCPNCICNVCGELACEKEASSSLVALRCSQCERKYHKMCINEKYKCKGEVASDAWLCGDNCRKVYSGLHSRVGVLNHIDDGFYWTLLRCIHGDQKVHAPQKIALMAECNAKLAVALNIMEECFLSMVDPRTGIDMIPHVIYNWGSNFARLNYQGFYTVVLEKADEIISVASIRVHGVRVAEMPLIATSSEYRRQGMCQRLMSAVEEMLKSFKVERLVLSAIPDLVDTWISGFGFKTMEDKEKVELTNINLMVFPGTVLLKKSLCGIDAMETQAGLDVDLSLREDGPMEVDSCDETTVLESRKNSTKGSHIAKFGQDVESLLWNCRNLHLGKELKAGPQKQYSTPSSGHTVSMLSSACENGSIVECCSVGIQTLVSANAAGASDMLVDNANVITASCVTSHIHSSMGEFCNDESSSGVHEDINDREVPTFDSMNNISEDGAADCAGNLDKTFCSSGCHHIRKTLDSDRVEEKYSTECCVQH